MSAPWSDFLADITLMSQDASRTYVILEGDEDRRYLELYFSKEHVRVKMAPGDAAKALVIRCVHRLNSLGRQNVIGVVDADYDRILGCASAVENLFHTETHDLDLDTLLTGVLEKVFLEIMDATKAKAHLNEGTAPIHERFLENAINLAAEFGLPKLACVRAFKAENNSNLSGGVERFPPLRDYCKCKRRGGTTSIVKDYRRFVQDLQRIHSHIELEKEIEREKRQDHPRTQIARGHDVFFFLALLSDLVARKTAQISPASLESDVRLAFSNEYFRRMNLYKFLVDWENARGRRMIEGT